MKRGKLSKKRREENAYKVRRDFLRREQEYGQANLAKSSKKWSKLLSDISSEHLKNEVLSYWHAFNKAIDFKDVEISLILDWIEEENQCYWKCLANHNMMMEYMIDFFYKGYKQIYNDLGTEVNKLLSLWVQDYDQINRRDLSNREFLEVMKYQMECITKKQEFEMITNYFSIFNENNTKFRILLGDIRYILSDKFEKLDKKMKEFCFEYLSNIAKRQKLGLESTEKYESLQKDIAANQKRKTQLERQFQQLVLKYNNLLEKNEQLLDDKAKEKDCLHEFFLLLRNKLFDDKNNDFLKRQVLSVSFNESFQEMESMAKRGSLMLKSLSACRRYESAREKVFPYPKELIVVIKNGDSQNKNICQELSLFWNRVASVNASRYTLNEERTYLKAENKNLRKQIHSYCKCLQCPSLPQVPLRTGKIPYTEGREMMQKHKTQNRRYNSVPEDISR